MCAKCGVPRGQGLPAARPSAARMAIETAAAILVVAAVAVVSARQDGGEPPARDPSQVKSMLGGGPERLGECRPWGREIASGTVTREMDGSEWFHVAGLALTAPPKSVHAMVLGELVREGRRFRILAVPEER
jgi:hypothetical protein